MPERKIFLTDRSLSDLAPPKTGRYLARDTELGGFFVQVGKRTKTFMVQGDLRVKGKRETVRMKIGEAQQTKTRAARAAAMEILGKIARGIDPRTRTEPAAKEPEQIGPTLKGAWERYRDAHMKRKGRDARTIENYRDHVERLMQDWQDLPLIDLAADPRKVVRRHDTITLANGPYIANGCMRTLRAIYNHARKGCRALPADNPVDAVDWNKERRRDTALGLAELKTWFNEAAALTHPIRREFHLFILLSGSRPDAIKRAKPEHIDFRRRTLHIPKPKGGEDKAFDIPLSRAMCRCLARARRLGLMIHPKAAAEWVFPADSESGHMAAHKEQRHKLSKWGNDLRQTYRTVGQIAGVPDLDMHLLMNHSVPGVNAGYITRAKLLTDHLRSQQEKISYLSLASASGEAQRDRWPFQSSRKLIAALTHASGSTVQPDLHPAGD